VLPGYEPSFLSSRPVRALELPLPLETALARAGIVTLGQLASADVEALAAVTGRAAAARLKAAARAEGESPIALAAPPAFVQEEWVVRDRHGDADALAALAATLARRAARRLKPLRLVAGALTVEVRRAGGGERRSEALRPGLSDEETIASAAGTLASTLLQPAAGVRTLLVRLARLQRRDLQAPLFPATPERRQA
jgi:nucleotidyltransferase/DNA polymerase involved in DNA repair